MRAAVTNVPSISSWGIYSTLCHAHDKLKLSLLLFTSQKRAVRKCLCFLKKKWRIHLMDLQWLRATTVTTWRFEFSRRGSNKVHQSGEARLQVSRMFCSLSLRTCAPKFTETLPSRTLHSYCWNATFFIPWISFQTKTNISIPSLPFFPWCNS